MLKVTRLKQAIIPFVILLSVCVSNAETPRSASIVIQIVGFLPQFGLGVISDISWHPQGDRIAVATLLGIRFHPS